MVRATKKPASGSLPTPANDRHRSDSFGHNQPLFFALCFPVARLFLAIPLTFDLPFDRVVLQLARVGTGEFLAVPLPRDREGDLPVLEFAVLDRCFRVV